MRGFDNSRMKKFCFIQSFLWAWAFWAPGLVQAQNLGGGLALGMNFSQIDGDHEGGFRKLGMAMGGYVVFQINDKLQLQPEVSWDQLGSVSKEGFFSNRFNYFSFPVLLNFQIPITIGDEPRMLKLQAGPVPSVLINAKDKLRTPPFDDISESFKSLDIRGTVGAVFEMNYRLAVSLRFGNSLIPFAKGTSTRFPQGGPWHKYLQLSLRLALVKP